MRVAVIGNRDIGSDSSSENLAKTIAATVLNVMILSLMSCVLCESSVLWALTV